MARQFLSPRREAEHRRKGIARRLVAEISAKLVAKAPRDSQPSSSTNVNWPWAFGTLFTISAMSAIRNSPGSSLIVGTIRAPTNRAGVSKAHQTLSNFCTAPWAGRRVKRPNYPGMVRWRSHGTGQKACVGSLLLLQRHLEEAL